MATQNNRQPNGKSNRAKREARARQEKPVLIAFSIVLIILLCAVALILFSLIADTNKQPTDRPSETGTDRSPSDSQTETESSSQSGQNASYDYVATASEKDKQGPLILINSTHEIDPALATDLEKLIDKMPKVGDKQMYQLLNGNLKLNATALSSFNEMMEAFYAAKQDRSVLVNGAYRSAEDQASLSTPVGQSDHHSGYLVTLKYLSSGKTESLPADYYTWFAENAYQYGFIIRYPDGKESVTGVRDYNYAFRYVGYAHAYYMHENNLCLEEYIELLNKKYNFEDEHLHFTADNGKVYDIYYVPAPSELTPVPIPKDLKYDLSGTNASGFVVTVTRS